MGLIKNLLFGRPNGIRRKIFGLVLDQNDNPQSSNEKENTPEQNTSGVAYGGKNKMEPPKDVTPPEGFEVVLHKEALASGEVTEIIIAGKAIAVCNVDGEFYAIENSCPLSDCPLSEGELDGFNLACPYHGWTFDVRDGKCATNPDSSIKHYEACVTEDAVCVKV